MNKTAQHQDLSQLEALDKAKAEASPKCLENSADAGSGDFLGPVTLDKERQQPPFGPCAQGSSASFTYSHL